MKNKLQTKDAALKIAVDGESASGKGTICKALAKEFDLYYCQSSLFYRKLAKAVIENNFLSLSEIINFIKTSNYLENISEDGLYRPDVTSKSSEIASIAEVRELLEIPQKNTARSKHRIIMEGRDIGTNIMPDADVKLYITAPIEDRAKRRYDQLKQNLGENISLGQVREDLKTRDKRDKERSSSPLKPADDAIIIHNSNISLDEFYNLVVREIIKKLEF